MKRCIWLFIFLNAFSGIHAQTETDVLRYSRLFNTGSARSAAMGGAFGALGGDISSWNINPAGIGVFRRPEVAYTSVLDFSRVGSGEFSKKNATYLIGSLGGVFTFYDEDSDWRAFNLGFSYSGQNNFNRKAEQAVNGSGSSLTDIHAVQSQGRKPEELGIFGAGPFYDTYLLYQTRDEAYHSILETDNSLPELVNQYRTVKEDGYQGEMALSFGTNYKDKLYMGIVMGMSVLSYRMRSAYTEMAEENAPSLLDHFTFNEYQKTKGTGFNLKFGVIYRPVSQIRLGAAIHSPTWSGLKHTIETSVYSCFTTETDPTIGRELPEYSISTKDYGEYYDPYTYLIRLNTPWRAVLSFATVLGKRLIISMDYEYVNYKAAKYKHPSSWMYDGYYWVDECKRPCSWMHEDDDDWEKDKMKDLSELVDYAPVNKAIKDIYCPAHNFRAGAEIRVTGIVSLRGGYGFQNSPYARDSGRNNQIRSISGGLGLNFGFIYGDFSYSRHHHEDESRFYDDDNIRALPVCNDFTNQEVRLTVGVRFPFIY